MAAYPNSIVSFTTKQNVVNVVDASHPNAAQDEIRAIEIELGTSPRISTALATTYTDVKTRLEFIETYYRQISNHDSHALLGGLNGDDHLQYIKVDGTRAFTGTAAIAAAPGAVAVGDTQSAGSAVTLARSDHRHAVTAAVAGASAVGDSAAVGAATTFAASDHRHSREAFGAVTAATTYGIASGNGAASTVARSDHTHGTPSLTANAPVTQSVGDAAAVGTGTAPAKDDHRHGMPAFGAVTAETTYGISSANGSASTLARSDHTHGTPALGTTVTDERTWGITPAAGTATTASKSDHTHGSPDATLTGPTGTVCMFVSATPPSGWLLCDGTSYLRATYPALFTALGGASSPWGLPDGTHFNVPDIRGQVVVGSMGAGPGGLTSRALAATGGAENVTLSAAQMPSHWHTVNSHSHTGGTGGGGIDHLHGFSTGSSVHDHSVAGGDYGNRIFVTQGGAQQYTSMTYGAGTDVTSGHSHGLFGAYGVGFQPDNIDPSGGSHSHSGTTGAMDRSANHTHSVSAESPGTDAQGSGASHTNMQPWVAMPYIIKT